MTKVIEVYVDGASRKNPGPSGAGAVIRHDGHVKKLKRSLGHATNNQAEYEAVILALAWIRKKWEDPPPVKIHTDSLLLAQQVKGQWKIKSSHLRPLRDKILAALSGIRYEIIHIPREENEEADKLAKEASWE